MENLSGGPAAEFAVVRDLRLEVMNTIESVESRRDLLRRKHSELVTRAADSTSWTLGLDSLFFQARLVTMECESLRGMVDYVDEHLYYELWSLRELMGPAVTPDTPVHNHGAKRGTYDFTLSERLHRCLVAGIADLKGQLGERRRAQQTEEAVQQMGLNIDNLVNASEYEARVLESRISLFCGCLRAFMAHQKKYLSRVGAKARLVLADIDREVHVEGMEEQNHGETDGDAEDGTQREETGEHAAESTSETENEDPEGVAADGEEEAQPHARTAVPPDSDAEDHDQETVSLDISDARVMPNE